MGGWRLKPIRILSSDLDGTLVGNEEALLRFRTFWEGQDSDVRPLLVYNSGRQIEDIAGLIEEVGLPKPDVLIGGVGSELHCHADDSHEQDYARSLGPVLDRELIASILTRIPGTRPQLEIYQHAFKSSWHLPDAETSLIEEIEGRLRDAGLDVGLVYSSNRDLDVLPLGTDKGSAIQWLAARLGIALDEVVVAGDTGNDIRMFLLPDVRGIVVSNAHPELRAIAESEDRFYLAKERIADGVLEGLRHFGLPG